MRIGFMVVGIGFEIALGIRSRGNGGSIVLNGPQSGSSLRSSDSQRWSLSVNLEIGTLVAALCERRMRLEETEGASSLATDGRRPPLQGGA
jgi:hypothetical protein